MRQFRVEWNRRRFPLGPMSEAEFEENHYYIGPITLADGTKTIYKGYLPTRSPAFELCCETKGSGTLEPHKKVPRFTWRILSATLSDKDQRFPYEELLFRYFPRYIVSHLHPLKLEELKKVHQMATTCPWLLCFKKWCKRLNIKPMRPRDCLELISELHLVPDKEITDGLYFLSTLQTEQERSGDTLFPHHNPDASCIGFLIKHEALELTEWGLCFARDAHNARLLTKSIQHILDNARMGDKPAERGWTVPCKPCPGGRLCLEQVTFAMHVQNHPITFLNAPPGTGKTEMIVWINCQFERVLNVTFVGAMVESMQKRLGDHPGIVHTIHHVTTVAKFVKTTAAQWLSEYQVIVVDEASNVDEKLLATFLSVIPNATKLILVGDLEQIFPIDPGCPFYDLVTYLPPDLTIKFEENHRVDPEFQVLAAVNNMIRHAQIDDIPFTQSGPLKRLERGDSMYPVLKAALLAMPNLKSVMDFQVVAVRNEDRIKINEAMELVCVELGLLNMPAQPIMASKLPLFAGKKIIFLKTHKPILEPKVDENDPDIIEYDGVRNGEIAQILSVHWVHGGEGDICLITTKNKRILISRCILGALLPHELDAAYCITCNKSQGSEWFHVLFWLPTAIVPFTREFAYVAFSRARQSVTMVGTVDELKQLCRSKARVRCTLFSKLLENQLRFYPLAMADLQTGLRPLENLVVAPLGAHGLFPVHKKARLL
jgi:AAA domain/UvrD-like helicase C-terminal domain